MSTAEQVEFEITSDPGPEPGQKNRSSNNFKFDPTPVVGTGVSISIADPAIYCVLIHYDGGSSDQIVGILHDGWTWTPPPGISMSGANFYLAAPQGASAAFDVGFSYTPTS